MVGDALLIVGAIPLAYWGQEFLRTWIPYLKPPPAFMVFATLAVLVLPVWFFLISFFKLHEIFDRLWRFPRLFLAMVELHFVVIIVISMVLFLTQVVMNRSLVAIYMGTTFAILLLERVVLQARFRYRLKKGSVKKHILLVGDESDEMRQFVDDALSGDVNTLIVGRIGQNTDAQNTLSDSRLPLESVGDIDDLGEVLHTKAVDEVMFFPPNDDPRGAGESLKECEALGIPACFYVHTARRLGAVPRLVAYHRHPFFIYEISPKRPETLAIKYTFDTLAAGIGIVLISPLLLVVSLLIWVTMGRPIIFSQARSGLFGREFNMLKFRTMVAGAEQQRDELLEQNEMDGPVFKIERDPRITRLGRFLRKWSIDELPQLFNVLMGDMSLVGPRPLPIKEQKAIVGWQRRRLSMRPGISGLWQVSGRNDIDFEQWMRLDLDYIDKWSLWLDIHILLRTVKVVVTGKGAS